MCINDGAQCKPQEASDAFMRAVRFCSSHPAYIHEYAKALQAEGRYAEAVHQFGLVLELQPNNSHALFRKASPRDVSPAGPLVA